MKLKKVQLVQKISKNIIYVVSLDLQPYKSTGGKQKTNKAQPGYYRQRIGQKKPGTKTRH